MVGGEGVGRLPRAPKERILPALIVASVLLFLLMLGWWSLTRRRHFSHDSMIYIQMARNLLAGRGLSADVFYHPRYRYPAAYAFPHPYTNFPPGYPVAIALLASLGLDPADAGLLIPVAALGGILAAATALLRRLYDGRTALMGLLLLVASDPLRQVSTVAWSEAPALLLLLLSVLLAVRDAARRWAWPCLVVGLLAGSAFAVRYAFAFALPATVLLVWRPSRGRLWRLMAVAAGWAIPAAPVLLRSWTTTGYPLGPPRPPSMIPLSTNVLNSLRALGGHYVFRRDEGLQLVLLGAALMALLGWALARRRAAAAAGRDLFLSGPRLVLPVWTLGYLLAVYAVVSQVNRTLYDVRVMVPAHLPLALAAAVILARAVPVSRRALSALVVAVTLLQAARPAHGLATAARKNDRKTIRESARLRWVQRVTTPADLIVGDDAHDLAFYFERKVLSFDYYNDFARLPPLTGPGLCLVLSWMRCEEHANVYIVLRDRVRQDPRWQREPLLSDLVHGRLTHSQAAPVARVRDAYIFRWRCGPCSTQGGRAHVTRAFDPAPARIEAEAAAAGVRRQGGPSVTTAASAFSKHPFVPAVSATPWEMLSGAGR